VGFIKHVQYVDGPERAMTSARQDSRPGWSPLSSPRSCAYSLRSWRPEAAIGLSCMPKSWPWGARSRSWRDRSSGPLESGRSDGVGSAARTHSEIWLGGLARETWDGSRMPPRTGAEEVGCLPKPTAPRPTTDLSRTPAADHADGA